MKYNYTVANLFFIKKDKAAFKSITNWISNNIEPPEIQFVKSVSSVITHILIEMENSNSADEAMSKASGYRLVEWSELCNKLINANVSVDEAINKIKNMVNEI